MLFIGAAGSDPVPQIDPTLLAVLSIFGGAALAAIAGFIGAWLQGRREHKRWLREKRFDAYLKLIDLVNHMDDQPVILAEYIKAQSAGDEEKLKTFDMVQINLLLDDYDPDMMWERFSEVRSSLLLLGPKKVDAAMNNFARSSADYDARGALRAELLHHMRRQLKIRY